MSELDKIRRRKLAELHAAQQNDLQRQMKEEAELNKKVDELEAIVKQLFTKEALERYGNIKAVDREKAIQIIAVIGQLAQSGKIGQVSDEMFKSLLSRLAPKKRDTKIRRA